MGETFGQMYRSRRFFEGPAQKSRFLEITLDAVGCTGVSNRLLLSDSANPCPGRETPSLGLAKERQPRLARCTCDQDQKDEEPGGSTQREIPGIVSSEALGCCVGPSFTASALESVAEQYAQVVGIVDPLGRK